MIYSALSFESGCVLIQARYLDDSLSFSESLNRKFAKGSGSIVPLAFPLIAGAGTLTTILSLRAVYSETNVLIGILLNLIFVYIVLRASPWLERVVGKSGFSVLRRVFGVILLAIAVKIFKTHAFSI